MNLQISNGFHSSWNVCLCDLRDIVRLLKKKNRSVDNLLATC